MTVTLAVSPGDPAGVGPSITVAALDSLRHLACWVVVGDPAWLLPRLSVGGPVEVLSTASFEREPGRVWIVPSASWPAEVVDARRPTAAGGALQLEILEKAAALCFDGRCDALVTGPTAKEAIVLAGYPFQGQTEHLARLGSLADDDVSMLFLGPRLNVGLVTTHLSLMSVPSAITKDRVLRTIRHLHAALRAKGTGTRIAVCGLNPHAGEGGLFGREEIDVVGPAVAASPVAVAGPVPAETAFRLAVAGNYDGIVALYHDQATIPSKVVDFGAAVNVTWGLPFLRTSVDHGVAYDAARAGSADPAGMVSAMALASQLASHG